MINEIRVDEVQMCFACSGKGSIEITDFDSLERIEKECEQCRGSGLLKFTGNIEVIPFKSYTTCNHDTKE